MADKNFNTGRPADDSTLTASPGQASMHLTARTGDRFGRYKILEEIGRGGCGAVFVAEQEEPVRRRVALKVIKLGMDTRQVMARFESERQALALMDHPNIAKVLDADSTDTGRPFFVMELVPGIKITDYCDQHKLSTSGRLKLFIQVCQAVQHAHQKGIIHRDIKPSNILVMLQDGAAVPKVIDFGIAKATENQKLTDKTVYTAFEQFIGTPAYMSPEQADMAGIDIDTRSDIYSLGVLLYELLVGETPFSPEELLGVGLEAMRRVLREKDPSRPSTKLSTMTQPDITAIARHRQSEPPKLIKSLRGDLDWVVMKCLEKDRARRYETANGLAADIHRHLNNEPVLARPPSRLYEFQKSVRRHKFGFAAAATLILVLAVGALVSTSQAVRATRAEREQSRLRQDAVTSRNTESKLRAEAQANEQRAKTEAIKSEQVAKFLKHMLEGVGPSVALGRDTAMLREILNQTAKHVATDLGQQPAAEAELCYTMGNTYYEIGEYQQAEAMHRRALELRRSIFGRTNALVADSVCSLAGTLAVHGYTTDAEAMQREALEMRRSLLGNEHPDVATSLSALANVLWHNRNFDEAEKLYRQALALRERIYLKEHPILAQSMNDLGFLLYLKGAERANLPEVLNESEQLLRGALEMRQHLFGDFHPSVSETTFNLANVLGIEGQLDEAEALLQQVLANSKKLLGDEHPRLIYTLHSLGRMLWVQRKFSEAEPIYKQELAIRRKRDGSNNGAVAIALNSLGIAITQQGRFAEAEPLIREALEIRRRLYGTTNNLPMRSAAGLARALIGQGKPGEAEALLRDELPMMEERFPNDWVTFWARNLIGYSLMLQKRYVEAEPLLRSGYLGMKQKGVIVHGEDGDTTTYAVDLDTARRWVSKFYEQTGWTVRATEWETQLAQERRSDAERYKKAADGGDLKSALALAWMLATDPHSEVRNGREAVRYGEKAASGSKWKDSTILDSLAAAYAESGQFDQAISAEQQAMLLLKDVSASRDYGLRLELYQARKPYRESEGRQGND
jgi:eukaryotic-like serine/threonine-protein kinase